MLAKLLGFRLLAAASCAVAQQPDEPAASAIRFNQVGFAVDGPKRFVVALAATTPLDWTLTDARNRSVASGRTVVFGDDAASGDHVHRIDVPGPIAAGRYRLHVGGLTSRIVTVRAQPFGGLYRDAVSFFYQQRAGVPIRPDLVQRPDLARPAGHAPEIAGCFDGIDREKVKWPGCAYRLNVTGGWYDAGDHGKYVVNGGISTWTLLNAYERLVRYAPRSPLIADGALLVPERGNATSDLLDEAKVEVAFLLSMQVPDRASAPVLRDGRVEMIEAGGLVHHKVADVAWTSLPTAPAEDRRPRVLFPPSTAATLNVAAVAAQCARIWRKIDIAFSQRCLLAATRAWAAAERNGTLLATDRFEGSGGYADTDLSDERFWAAAELYLTTGDRRYRTALLGSRLFRAPAVAEIGWNAVGAAGTISLLTVPGSMTRAELAPQRRALLATADRDVGRIARQGYAIPYGPAHYPWGSNSAILNVATVLGVAHDLTGARNYRDGVVDALDYVLGRNPLDRSFVTGYGDRPMRNPHHRFWTRQANPRYPAPPRGVLSGGPNDSAMTDEVALEMKGRCRPQTCWVDDYRAFTQNEVAINWNAPLVWITAFLTSSEAR